MIASDLHIQMVNSRPWNWLACPILAVILPLVIALPPIRSRKRKRNEGNEQSKGKHSWQTSEK